jgi:hypothetical protein
MRGQSAIEMGRVLCPLPSRLQDRGAAADPAGARPELKRGRLETAGTKSSLRSLHSPSLLLIFGPPCPQVSAPAYYEDRQHPRSVATSDTRIRQRTGGRAGKELSPSSQQTPNESRVEEDRVNRMPHNPPCAPTARCNAIASSAIEQRYD